ncbi:MAG: GxxExxY protein, partial [Planctomycetaceae bacterium]|nr:GxxExxY protein [Planctomycetaceae bacterium]
MNSELIHKELSESIIGAAMTVLNHLKPGLGEKLYERALAIELRKRGHRVVLQKEFLVTYDGHAIGLLRPDMIVDDLVIADTKVVTAFHENEIAQMLGYLAITQLQLALLLNFKVPLPNSWVVFGFFRSVFRKVATSELSSGSTEGGRPLHLRLRIAPAFAR